MEDFLTTEWKNNQNSSITQILSLIFPFFVHILMCQGASCGNPERGRNAFNTTSKNGVKILAASGQTYQTQNNDLLHER